MAAAAAGPASAAASSIRSARKLLERMEKQTAPLSVPLPRTVAERVERQAGYEDTKQDVTKWQPIVKVGGSWSAQLAAHNS
jgi:U3 small nucleolar RNA-associated protein 14